MADGSVPAAAGILKDTGDFNRGIIHVYRVCSVSLAPDTVVPHAHSVVTGKDDHRAVDQSGFLKKAKQTSDLCIHCCDGGIVAGETFPPVLLPGLRYRPEFRAAEADPLVLFTVPLGKAFFAVGRPGEDSAWS